MNDYGEIVAALTELMWALHHRDQARFADSWSADLDFEVVMFGQPMRLSGRDEMVSRFTANWTQEPSMIRHQLGVVNVEPLGEGKVRARYYCTYVNVGEEPALAGMGEYDDDLSREPDGRWRVKRRRHRFLTPLKH